MIKADNILALGELLPIRKSFKVRGLKVVFTNGCFDILHAGHVDYLNKAKHFGDVLIVGMNSDSSMKRIKGENRPILPQEERGFVIANLKAVDYVTYFSEDTPYRLISELIPDILVKGADWQKDQIVGRETVEKNGGKVETIDFITDQSTSNIIHEILQRYSRRFGE